jgi:hypothetical protein
MQASPAHSHAGAGVRLDKTLAEAISYSLSDSNRILGKTLHEKEDVGVISSRAPVIASCTGLRIWWCSVSAHTQLGPSTKDRTGVPVQQVEGLCSSWTALTCRTCPSALIS